MQKDIDGLKDNVKKLEGNIADIKSEITRKENNMKEIRNFCRG